MVDLSIVMLVYQRVNLHSPMGFPMLPGIHHKKLHHPWPVIKNTTVPVPERRHLIHVGKDVGVWG